MKVLRLGLLLLCFSLFFAASWVPGVAASEYLGDYCWQFGIGPIFKLSVTYEGGTNWSLHGKGINVLNNIESAVFGNLTLAGDNALVCFTSSVSDPANNETLNVTVTGVLDSTLNGTGTATFTDFFGSSPAIITKSSGTLAFVACP